MSHVLFHRIPAICTSIISSIALGFVVGAGTTCQFISVTSFAGDFFEYETVDGSMTIEKTETQIGILCQTPLFSRKGDLLWELSTIFWIVSASIGGFACLLAWLLSTCLPPSEWNWKILSIASAISAVLSVPAFLMFEAQPCINATCTISTGCFYLIASTVLWIAVTMLTQCLDPPQWAKELDAWRVREKPQSSSSQDPSSSSSTPKYQQALTRWRKRRYWSNLKISKTSESEEPLDLLENGSYYANSSNSRLLLKVEEGRRPGDDQKSVTTFGDLDDYVKLAEEHQARDTLLGGDDAAYPEDEKEPILFDQEAPEEETAIVASNTNTEKPVAQEPLQYYTDPATTKPAEEGNDDLLNLLDANQPVRTAMSPPPKGESKLGLGLRALKNRIRSSKRTFNTEYALMVESDDGGDADREDEGDSEEDVSLEESPRRTRKDDSYDRELLDDWNKLHATDTGVTLPRTISFSGESEPVYCTSEDGSNSLPDSFTQLRSGDPEEQSSLSNSDISDSSDQEDANAAIVVSKPRPPRGRRRRRNRFSSANSLSSRTSLLGVTIDEETDIDLKEFEESDLDGDDEQTKSVPEPYPVSRTKSVPEQSARMTTTALVPYSFNRTKSAPAPDPTRKSFNSSSSLDGLEINSLTEDAGSDYTPYQRDPYTTSRSRRCRSVSLPRRKIHPVNTRRSRSVLPAAEQVTRGIHSTRTHVISDDSSADSGKTAKSSKSLMARNARMERISSERRRTKSLPRNPKTDVVMDPMLHVILRRRNSGAEYGSDEASL